MFKLSYWPYVKITDFSGDIKADMTNLLALNNMLKTAEHCISVANISEKIAGHFGLDKSIALTSALLHDISNVIRPQDMFDYAVKHNWEIDLSERKFPFLLHQRLSAVFAEKLFGIFDKVVLSAISCHSTLKSNPS